MDIDQEELLQRTYALVKENNKLIKRMRRRAVVYGLFRLVLLVIMVGVPIWVYFTFLQPVFQQGINTLDQVQELSGQVGEQILNVRGSIDLIPEF